MKQSGCEESCFMSGKLLFIGSWFIENLLVSKEPSDEESFKQQNIKSQHSFINIKDKKVQSCTLAQIIKYSFDNYFVDNLKLLGLYGTFIIHLIGRSYYST